MNERERLVAILRELDLPRGQYVISGSGVLVLNGIERSRPMGDLDIFCATRLWFDKLLHDNHRINWGKWQLTTPEPNDFKRRCDPPVLSRMMHGLQIDLFSEWRKRGVGDINVGFWIHNAVIVDDWPCVSLQLLYDWKRDLGRAKDLDDLRILQQIDGIIP